MVFHFSHLRRKEKEKRVKKIHRHFAYASKERLLQLVKNGGCNDCKFLALIETVFVMHVNSVCSTKILRSFLLWHYPKLIDLINFSRWI